MKPRTKQEREVVELSSRLAPPTPSDLRYFTQAGTKHYALYSGKRVKCTECGHEWRKEGLKKQVRCPECGQLLEIENTRSRKKSEVLYCIILQSFKGWQVVRYFRLSWSCPVKGGRTYHYFEVVQLWIGMNGVLHVMARKRLMGPYIDSWNLYEPMTLKRNKNYYVYHLSYWGSIVKSVTPTLRRNGLKKNLYGMRPYRLITLLLNNPLAETMVKSGYGDLLRCLDSECRLGNSNFVAATKIVMRNRYKISDVTMWSDLVQSLITLEKDVHSPHYVCPKDLKDAHDKAVAKCERKRELERQRRAAEQMRKDKKAARSYVKRMKKFFKMVITDGKIVVCVLKNVAEFEEEGKAMHHCVFSNRYFAKEHSLIMSAKVEGERQETVEVNLENFKIVQSRGVNNSSSKYHKQIVDLVTKNMPTIMKLSRAV